MDLGSERWCSFGVHKVLHNTADQACIELTICERKLTCVGNRETLGEFRVCLLCPRHHRCRGVDYTGADASAAMVARAKQANPELAERFSIADARQLPFTDGEFDACLICGVMQYLMHTEGAPASTAEIHRVLGTGGKLLAIEQVSYSGRSSGAVPYPSSEADYVTTLGRGFRVVDMTRIRCSFFGRPTRWLLNSAQRAPRVSSRLMECAARREIRRARNAPASRCRRAEYFDLLIIAEAG